MPELNDSLKEMSNLMDKRAERDELPVLSGFWALAHAKSEG
jgi:hypothetical protein